jgi:hypothetical protein
MSASEMIPTMVFCIFVKRLDLFAGPHEKNHQGKKAHGGEDVENVSHGSFLVV